MALTPLIIFSREYSAHNILLLLGLGWARLYKNSSTKLDVSLSGWGTTDMRCAENVQGVFEASKELESQD